MARRSFRPRTVLARSGAVAVLALGLAACTSAKKEGENTGAAATPQGAGASGTTPVVAVAAPANDEGLGTVYAAPRLDNPNKVLGHVLIPSPAKLIENVASITPPQFASFVNEGMFRGMLNQQVDAMHAAAVNQWDLSKPVGCAAFKEAGACFIGYPGGTKALIEKLGETGRDANPGKHEAKYTIAGEPLFIDSLGDNPVLSVGDESFGRLKGYLEKNLLARTNISADIEAIGYPAVAVEIFPEFAEASDTGLTGERVASEIDDPKTAKATKLYFDRIKEVSDDTGSLKNMAQMAFGLAIRPSGIRGGTSLWYVDGSKAWEDAKAMTRPADATLVATLPDTTAAFLGGGYDYNAMFKSPTGRASIGALAGAYAIMTDKNEAEVLKALERYYTEHADRYDGQTAAALWHEPETLGGFVSVSRLKPGQSGADLWSRFVDTFTPANILPAEWRPWIDWSFKRGQGKAGGATVDRWTIVPGKAALAKLEEEAKNASAKDKAARKWFEDNWGGLQLVIDRVESDGHVFFAVAPKAESTYLERAIQAVRGQNNLANSPALAKIRGRFATPSYLSGLDVKRSLEWAKAVMPADEAAKIPDGIGTDLSDVYLTGALDTHQTLEVVVARSLVVSVTNAVQSQLNGAAQ